MASPVPRDRQPGPPGPDADAAQAEPAQQGGADASMAEALGLRGGELMDSITNAVQYYTAQGFDAFDEALLTSQAFTKQQGFQVLQGSIKLYGKVLAGVDAELAAFERTTLRACLRAPPRATPPQPEAEAGEAFDAASEAQLDERLASLRSSIVKARAERRALQAQTSLMDRELALFGDPAPLQAVAGAVAAGKENLVDDAAAIADKSRQLGPLLQRARAILAHRQGSRAAQPPQNAATVAEKEIAARRAAVNIPTDELRRLRECLLAE